MTCDLTINKKALTDFSGASLLDYTVSAPEITSYDFQGINRTRWKLLKQTFGRRSISISVIFKGPNRETVELQRSKFNLECWGVISLALPDGYLYRVRVQSLGTEELVGLDNDTCLIKATYSFIGVRQKNAKTVSIPAGGGDLFCLSTMPFTDCRLTTTVGAAAASYALGGAVFSNVQAGDVLVFDGIDGKITRNGTPDAANCNWTTFPSLAPGVNTFTNTDRLTVVYYPTFI